MPEPDRVVVSDTGPFITLERLPGGFALLRQLYDRVLLPEQVLAELAAGRPAGDDYLQELGLTDLVAYPPRRSAGGPPRVGRGVVASAASAC